MELEYKPYTLDFNFPAGTSRGVMQQRHIWLVKIKSYPYSPFVGSGEIAPLPGLSMEDPEEIPDQLSRLKKTVGALRLPTDEEGIYDLASQLAREYPGIRFGLEMAMLDLLNGGKQIWFDSELVAGSVGIPVNGLIWMNEPEHMKQQADNKIAEGYDCLKMKIGALDFDQELEVLDYIRSRFDGVLRVDANGAFGTHEVLKKLDRLSAYDLHSVEQPIMPRQWTAMQLVCRRSAVPVALDEELIGLTTLAEKERMLEEVQPSFLVIKPSLVGGFAEADTWIRLAGEHGMGWWITSALESNLGLSAIAQFTARYRPALHQGLGTGGLYTNNLEPKTHVDGGRLVWNV